MVPTLQYSTTRETHTNGYNFWRTSFSIRIGPCIRGVVLPVTDRHDFWRTGLSTKIWGIVFKVMPSTICQRKEIWVGYEVILKKWNVRQTWLWIRSTMCEQFVSLLGFGASYSRWCPPQFVNEKKFALNRRLILKNEIWAKYGYE